MGHIPPAQSRDDGRDLGREAGIKEGGFQIAGDGALVARIDDDGPGIPADQRAEALAWGRRLDDAPPGSGFGLSIVRDTGRLPTGMDPLDRLLGGGFRASDFVLLGGRPGVGKTIAGLQWARAMAMSGATAVIASYEHDEQTLLGRLVALEIGNLELAEL